jgi:hypothetical protein
MKSLIGLSLLNQPFGCTTHPCSHCTETVGATAPPRQPQPRQTNAGSISSNVTTTCTRTLLCIQNCVQQCSRCDGSEQLGAPVSPCTSIEHRCWPHDAQQTQQQAAHIKALQKMRRQCCNSWHSFARITTHTEARQSHVTPEATNRVKSVVFFGCDRKIPRSLATQTTTSEA